MLLFTAWCLICVQSDVAWADQDAGAPAAASAAPSSAPPLTPPAPPSPALQALLDRTKDIRALIAGDLDVAADPASLFDVDLADESAVHAEVRRLGFIIDAATSTSPSDAAAPADAAAVASATGGDGGAGTEGGAPIANAMQVDDAYWDARLALDEASHAFLKMSKARRDGAVKEHKKRQLEASDHDRELADAARKAREAEEEQRRSLEAARHAESEGQRRVEAEKARLHGLVGDYSELNQVLLKEREGLASRADVRLAWERRVDEIMAALEDGRGDAEDAADIYDELGAALQASHAELNVALGVFGKGSSRLPPIGKDPLSGLGLQVDLSEVRALRRELEAQHADIAKLERGVVAQHAATLVKEVRSLNDQRLRLLEYLPSTQHDELVGMGATGRKEAKRELSNMWTVLRYHFAANVQWVRNFKWRALTSKQRLGLILQALKALAMVVVFVWWYRRADEWLAAWSTRDKRTRSKQFGSGRGGGAIIAFVRRIRRPMEWLALLSGLRFVLATDDTRLEFELVTIILWWIFGEALVVNIIDALFARRHFRNLRSAALNRLRLRSLHFVGRLVVVFGLTLSVTVMLLGHGTINTWVVRAGYIAALPALLVLVHWYRPHILEHFERRKHAGGIAGWIADHNRGLWSYLAAALGALVLSYNWVSHSINNYAARFEFVRRLLAYWFRREVSKHHDGDAKDRVVSLAPLNTTHFESLRPDRHPDAPVPCEADDDIRTLTKLIEAPGNGVHAIVGERGSGKSTLLRRVADKTDAVLVDCNHDGVDDLLRRIGEAFELPAKTTIERLDEALAAHSSHTTILIDNAHNLIRPTIGGLDDFDCLLRIARRSSMTSCTWIIALDSAIWGFLHGARGAKPLFDDVHMMHSWSEENIATLLRRRCGEASVMPSFERLITDLPEHADDIDRKEALKRAETNYYRLLWDYSSGNPGIALHFWRESLGINTQGGHSVKLFSPPTLGDLDGLPDNAVFVLRAVLQVECATVDDIIAATMLPPDRVRDALRYAHSRGYLEAPGTHVRIEWGWLRAIGNFLKRRNLLFES